jgi:CO/xanthine dehydrogenase FAD-binding subunit
LDYDWIAGGTDLLPNYKWHLNVKSNVISLANIDMLSKVSKNHIGAMARLYDLSNSSDIHPLIAKSAGLVASVMIRRSATLGGNLINQRNGVNLLTIVTNAIVELVRIVE